MAERLSTGLGGLGLMAILFFLEVEAWNPPNWISYPGIALGVLLVIGALTGRYPRRGTTLKRLQPRLVKDTNAPTGECWWNLKVHNPNSQPVNGCYGKIRGYRIVSGRLGGAMLPRLGSKLSWRVEPFSTPRVSITIGGHSDDYLDVAMSKADAEGFFTPEPAPPVHGGGKLFVQQPIALSYPLPKGQYELEIEVGSETETLSSTTVTLWLDYRGGLQLDALESK